MRIRAMIGIVIAFVSCREAVFEQAIAVDWSFFYRSIDWVEKNGELVRQFRKEVKILNDQRIAIIGFMIPLQQGRTQKHFILSAASAACNFCSSGGDGSHIEVYALEPVEYSLDPITVTGFFRLYENDENGRFFRITGAQAVPLEEEN